jgi:hypothetical protein
VSAADTTLAQRTLAMVALQHLGQSALVAGDDAFLAALSEAWVRAGLGLQWFASDVVYNASFDDAITRIEKARRGRHRAKLRHQADAILRMVESSPLKVEDWSRARWDAMGIRAQSGGTPRGDVPLDHKHIRAIKDPGVPDV